MVVSTRTIGVLSPGEMGSQVGLALREAGARVITCVAGRSDRSAMRAREAGIEALPTIDDLVRQAEMIISVVPSLSARPLATQIADGMKRTGSRPLYVDANSIGPSTARAIAEAVGAAGGDFVDGSIIGSAANLRRNATFYLSGPRAPEAASVLEPAVRTSILGSEPGQASGFKVLYAGLTKGMSALGIELLSGAVRLGLDAQLLEKYRSSHPAVMQFWETTLPGLPQRAGRRSEEMVELGETLESQGLEAHMAHGAQATLASLAARYRQDGGPDGETLDELVAWLGEGAVFALDTAPHHGVLEGQQKQGGIR